MKIDVNLKGYSPQEMDSLTQRIENGTAAFTRAIKSLIPNQVIDFSKLKLRVMDSKHPAFYDAIYFPHRKEIVFYGIKSISFLWHELTHYTFPNYHCNRHAEGFAFYIQRLTAETADYFFGFANPDLLILPFMNHEYYSPVTNWFDFIKDSYYYKKPQMGSLYLARALSAGFVGYLIQKYGIEYYLSNFYNKLKTDEAEASSERGEFQEYWETLILDPILQEQISKFLIEKEKIVDPLYDFSISAEGLNALSAKDLSYKCELSKSQIKLIEKNDLNLILDLYAPK